MLIKEQEDLRNGIRRDIHKFIQSIQGGDQSKAAEHIRDAITGHVQIKYNDIYNRVSNGVVQEALTDSAFPGYEDEVEPRYRENVRRIEEHPDLENTRGLYHNALDKGTWALQFPLTSQLNIQTFKIGGAFGPRLNSDRKVIILNPQWTVEKTLGSSEIADGNMVDKVIKSVIGSPSVSSRIREFERVLENQGWVFEDPEAARKKITGLYRSRMGANVVKAKSVEIPVKALVVDAEIE